MDLTAERGRWAGLSTARIYVNVALAELGEQKQTTDTDKKVASYAKQFQKLAAS